jgi:hypothetical protein
MATKKTLYHSELSKLGPVTIEITSDLMESKYKKGTYFVGVKLDGEERTLNIENDECGAALDQRKGQVLTIEATGSRESAEITILDTPPDEPAAQAPARPAARPAPVARPAAARPAAAPAKQQAAAAPAHKPGSTAALIQLGNLEIKVQCMCAAVSDALIAGRDIVLTDAQLAGMAGRMFIESVRAGLHHGMPSDHLIDCTPKGGKAPAQSCTPKGGKAPAQSCTPKGGKAPAQSEPSDNDGGAN